MRTKKNWPPVRATPAGPHEKRIWDSLPRRIKKAKKAKAYGPRFTF